mgnify:CR=1
MKAYLDINYNEIKHCTLYNQLYAMKCFAKDSQYTHHAIELMSHCPDRNQPTSIPQIPTQNASSALISLCHLPSLPV